MVAATVYLIVINLTKMIPHLPKTESKLNSQQSKLALMQQLL